VPAGAKFLNEDQEPDSEDAVAYTLSLRFQPVRYEPRMKHR
jgi:hypothetical protein